MINSIDIIYRIVPAVVFIFIHITIFHLRSINLTFESRLIQNNNELKATLNELKKAQQQLIQSEKMVSVGNLSSGIAHEINNPLNIITGGLHILKNNMTEVNYPTSLQEKKVKKSIEMIDEGNKKASAIVSSLMTFSFRGVSALQAVNIELLIDKTLLFLQVNIPDSIHIIKEFNLSVDVPVYKEKLHQVFLNILDNAIFVLNIDGQNNRKELKISTEKTGEYAQITISNTGPHFEPEQLNTIFDPFYTTKDPGEGTGLGLSISYSLINEHKGFLFAENTNTGVSFVIKLPIEA